MSAADPLGLGHRPWLDADGHYRRIENHDDAFTAYALDAIARHQATITAALAPAQPQSGETA